jgi:hypothetical protein
MRYFKVMSLLVTATALTALGGCAKEPILPRSFRAEVVATVDPARVRMQTTGVGEEFEWAVRDAQKAGIARVVQDLVQSQEEKGRFDEKAQKALYSETDRFIEGWTLKDRRRRPDGDIEATGEVVVNRRLIEDHLVAAGIILERRKLMAAIERPTMAVLPDAATAKAEWTTFSSNHAASYLTQRKYDTVDVATLRQVEADTAALRTLEGVTQDPKARIALQSGADIYLEYQVTLDGGKVGKDSTVKASASVKAFETTTARQIGAATAFSKDYAATAGARDRAIAEALGDAIDRVLANVDDFWKDDMAQGRQYLVSIRGDFGGKDREARRLLHGIIRDTAAEFKENLATDKTLNYRIWHQGSNSDLLFALQDKAAAALGGRELREVTTNRKLLVLDLR